MSRPGQAAPRSLTLTEELEKLEQSITLTLQGLRLVSCLRPVKGTNEEYAWF